MIDFKVSLLHWRTEKTTDITPWSHATIISVATVMNAMNMICQPKYLSGRPSRALWTTSGVWYCTS